MALIPDDEILRRLRQLYKDAFAIDVEPTDDQVIIWARDPEIWAQHQIAHHGKSWHMAEAVVRSCRSYLKRAERAALARRQRNARPTPGADPFDPLMPTQ